MEGSHLGQGDEGSEPHNLRQVSGPGVRGAWTEPAGTEHLLPAKRPTSIHPQVILPLPWEAGIVNPVLPHFLKEKTDFLSVEAAFSGLRAAHWRHQDCNAVSCVPQTFQKEGGRGGDGEREKQQQQQQNLALSASVPPCPSHCVDYLRSLLTGVSASSLFPRRLSSTQQQGSH